MNAISTDMMTGEGAAPRPLRTTRRVAWRSAAAGLILQAAIVLTIAIALALAEGLPSHMARQMERMGEYVAAGLVAICCGLGGALWAWCVARIAGLGKQARVAWAGALYGPVALASVFLLNEAEQYFVEGIGRALAPVHVTFAVSFTLAAAVTAGLLAGAVGIALRDGRLALRLMLYAGAASGVAFLIADVVQDLLGRRVGGVNAAATATMITVMFVGNIVASAAASAVVGVTLHRWARKYGAA